MRASRERAVVVIGAGGHARVVISLLQAAGEMIAMVLDDDPRKWGTSLLGVPIRGPISQLAEATGHPAIIAIGDNGTREEIASQWSRIDWLAAVHPTAYVHSSAQLQPGAVVCAGAVIQPDAFVGAHAIVNTAATVDHDCVVEDYAHLAPGVHLAGGVRIGEGALLGIGSVVIPGRGVGEWTTVGAGGVVVSDLPARATAVGVPARLKESLRMHMPIPASPVRRGPISMSAADLDEADIQSVVEVLRSGRLALGPKALEFERLMAEYVGVKHAVAVNSGTSALHLIVRALGLGPHDEVLVPSFTFAASVNACLYEGATPVFVDIEPETYNLDPEDLVSKITPRTRAIMAVDIFGHPADWGKITRIAHNHGLRVIDDACEALGAEYRGTRIGRFGDAAAFAFYPNKQLTTGEGGMVVTNDDGVAETARSLRNQGRGEMGAWLEHERLGYNYRLDEMSAALGASQMKRFDTFMLRREHVARKYHQRLEGLDRIRTPVVLPDVRMSWFVYVITLEEGLERDAVMEALELEGVPCRGYFSPIHLQPYIRSQFGLQQGKLPVTESVAQRTIALPFHNGLSDAEVDRVVSALSSAVARVAAERAMQRCFGIPFETGRAKIGDEPETLKGSVAPIH